MSQWFGTWKSRAVLALILLAVAAAAFAAYLFRPPVLEPVPALGTLEARAERGAYLATLGNCSTCHTSPGRDEYAGGLAFPTDFGTIYSTNITSDLEKGIGKWSFEDFHRSMKHGLRPNGTNLYPAFPYTYFAGLSDADIASLFLFMRTVPASAQTPPDNVMDFPFDERGLMRAWNNLFHQPQPFSPDPERSAEWNRGAYVTETLAHCGACHTPRNALGGEKPGKELTGGTYYDRVLTGRYRKWTAVNLTPAENGLAAWSHDDIVAYLLEGQNPRAVVHGPMNEVVMHSTRHFRRSDAEAMATYLKGLPADGKLIDWPLIGGNYELGETVYTVHCGTCHLPDGEGDPTLGVPLAGNAIVQAEDPASLINVILYGPQLPPPPFVSERTRMPGFGKRLSSEDVAAVATYLRNSFGNDAGAVSENDVKAQR